MNLLFKLSVVFISLHPGASREEVPCVRACVFGFPQQREKEVESDTHAKRQEKMGEEEIIVCLNGSN